MACELPGSAHAERRHTFRTEAANRVVPITAVDVIVAGGEPVGGSEKCPSSSVHRRFLVEALRAAPGLLLASFADAAVLPAHSGDDCHRRCPLVLRQGRRFARCVFTPR